MLRGVEFKRIVVLANSIKKGARCIAGRDVGTGNDLSVGDWVRPVSDESEGELEPRHMRVADRSSIKVLEIVDVPLIRWANVPAHPEDWIVDIARPWKKVAALDPTTLAAFEDVPKNLWLESRAHTDRVTGSFLLRQPNHQSLFLIRPTNVRFELSCKHNEYKNRDQKRTRVRFSYAGQEYQMNLTDPEFTARHCPAHPAAGAKAVVVDLPYKNCLLCVSLTPEFEGYHYKVAATVLELK